MKDREIIELYWVRNESAITATAEKYGNYCHTIAYNILQQRGCGGMCQRYIPPCMEFDPAAASEPLVDLLRENHAQPRSEPL